MEKRLPLMFVGTGSDVGKSIITAGFCRIFKQDGYTPAPFKAQNMANNSYVTADGLELGRAQAMQAEAANIACHTDMNPLLLKPSSDKSCQVILNGKPIGQQSAYHYFRIAGREPLRQAVHEAFDRLATRYNPIVMEGAGSVAEINLKQQDLVNMSMAMYANAAVILVADIDRGGVFASVYGSIMLLPEQERKQIKGIIINKFRGDIRLFESGIALIESLCHVPVLGVIPYFDDIVLEEEDAVALQAKQQYALAGKVNVVVVLLRHISNFTDFNRLEQDPRVHLYYSANQEEIEKADIVLIPGSKSTLADLYELRRSGIAQSILHAHRRGATVVGLCGGYQMMGQEICDPQHVEGEIECLPGLGLLPITTKMLGEKITRQVTFEFMHYPEPCQGYEIHMGETQPLSEVTKHSVAVNHLQTGYDEGYQLSDRCFGTYIHGILDNQVVINHLLAPFTEKLSANPVDYEQFKQQQYDKLADHLRRYVDVDKVYEMMQINH